MCLGNRKVARVRRRWRGSLLVAILLIVRSYRISIIIKILQLRISIKILIIL